MRNTADREAIRLLQYMKNKENEVFTIAFCGILLLEMVQILFKDTVACQGLY